MGAATATKTTYGFRVTGDTGSITVTTEKIWVKKFMFIAATGGNAVVATDKNAASIFKDAGAVAATAYVRDVGGEKGVCYDGLIVSSLSNGSDVLHIIVA